MARVWGLMGVGVGVWGFCGGRCGMKAVCSWGWRHTRDGDAHIVQDCAKKVLSGTKHEALVKTE